MIALDPVRLTGSPQDVKLNTTEACCALIANESGYGLKVKMSGSREQWLGAWTADLFEVPANAQSITLTPVIVGSLINAPSKVALITLSGPGERIAGTYPMALTRQAGISAGGGAGLVPPTPVTLQAASAVPLGDTSALSLSADQVSTTCSPGPGGATTCPGVLASFKAAAGQTIALVGAYGAFLTGTNIQVAPQFGQATTAGHLLTAQVDTDSDDPSTTAAGWALAVKLRTANGLCSAIFYKKNCGAAEAAPVFNCPGGLGPATGQLAEWSGADTVSPLDQVGSAQVTDSPLQVANPTIDAAFGDLLLFSSHWGFFSNVTVSFAETVNNNGSLTHAGDDGATSQNHHATHAYAINPAGSPTLPLGVAPWAYDAAGTSAPAVAAQAKVVLAATPGKTYTAAMFDAGMVANAAAANYGQFQILDGASVIFNRFFPSTGATGTGGGFELTDLGLRGTTGNSMTGQANSGLAAYQQWANLGAYLH